MGGWKQKEESSLLVPSTFLFLYQPSVCLCVSRVRAYLTTNQHKLNLNHLSAYHVTSSRMSLGLRVYSSPLFFDPVSLLMAYQHT